MNCGASHSRTRRIVRGIKGGGVDSRRFKVVEREGLSEIIAGEKTASHRSSYSRTTCRITDAKSDGRDARRYW